MTNKRKILITFSLLSSNLWPLVGVTFWQWTAFNIIFAYWLESFVIGIFTIGILIFVGESADLGLSEEGYSEIGVAFGFGLFYFGILLFYLEFINKIIGDPNTAHQSLFAPLKPFLWPIILMTGSLFLSNIFECMEIFKRNRHPFFPMFSKYFMDPFIRLAVVHGLVFSALYYMKTAKLGSIFFILAIAMKVLLDVLFWISYREKSLPPIIKDPTLFDN